MSVSQKISVLFWGLLVLAAGAQAQERAQVIALKASSLVDVVAGTRIQNPVVLIRGERIEAIGAGLEIPADAQLIDLGARTLVPGLIDAHVHIAGGGAFTPERGALRSAASARKTLLAGFTSVRSMGGRNFGGIALKNAIDEGDVIGPRIFDAGTMLTVSGGHCGGGSRPSPTSAYVDGPGVGTGVDGFVKLVRDQARAGADFIKICLTGGFVSGTNPNTTYFTEDELRAVIETAHRQGLKVAVHAYSAPAIKQALRLGADSIEHASLLDDEVIRLLKRNPEQVVVPTLSIFGTSIERAKAAGASPVALKNLQLVSNAYLSNGRKLVKGGVTLIYGSDGPAGDNANEFLALVEVGLSPLQAIQAATISAAKFLNADEDIGSLSPGKYADIIAVDSDPLADVSTFQTVPWVMKSGQVYKGEFLP